MCIRDSYYYFYDWKISTEDKYCVSDLVPVTAFPDSITAIRPVLSTLELSLTPNPTLGEVKLILEASDAAQIEIYSADGQARKLLRNVNITGQSCNLDMNE